ncbi:glycosyltransferase family 4 protein [Acidiphilium acidophilum]|uniref:glycosyltransferase family 4 protein n=1 Tax=Acidiphilium acidophilum TaxID=76588 RepID=UPI002E8E6B1E|nr:glycosyltransferase family 4 protein [Acidiphilium acidophilum]
MSISVHLDRIGTAPPGTASRDDAHPLHADTIRVLMATRYARLGASSRLRLLQYAAPLATYGIACTPRPFLSNDYVTALYENRSRLPAILAAYARAPALHRAIREHDIVWIEKELLPFLPAAFERTLLGANRKFILDFDDAWFLRYGNEPGGTLRNRLLRATLGNKFPALLRRAALTIVANQTLRDWAIRNGARNTLLLPTVVDLAHYPITPRPPHPTFTIGWIGTPVTAPYLTRLTPTLQTLARESPTELLIIGAPNFTIPGIPCRHLPWSETTEAATIAEMDVGIMPLPDDAWTRGKSGYKLIQYMACGRPTIGSPVGANSTIIDDGTTGFLATTDTDWLTRLRQLRDTPTLRQTMSTAARTRVATNYALQSTAPHLASAIRAIAGK